MAERVLKMGMVGGGRGAFIGAVHRTAAMLDGGVIFAAGCLSSTPERAIASGEELGLARSRNYPTWRAMLEGELSLPREDRIDFVSIVTPNHVHYEVARAFAEAGIAVVCDKPMTTTSAEAESLVEVVRRSGVVFGVTYNYSGYPLVKQMREMVGAGELGTIRKVVVEYNQGWLAGKLEGTGQKQAAWRTDPAQSGAGGAIGDIGSHAENLATYVTGLPIEAICADLTSFVPGRRLDDDANLLLRFEERGGVQARGVLIASQVEIGHENDLRIRVYGERGSLRWSQEDPNYLVYCADGQPERIYRRGNGYLGASAVSVTRLPPGHPEAFFEAFANIYNAVGRAIREHAGGLEAPAMFDFPGVEEGARGVRFIEQTVESARGTLKWTSMAAASRGDDRR
ncbi:MAG: Gfo/Idh/MocA family oxidoreductase [Phycisphaeraceae bacterium]|nr:Gfo/Idh/MocA family oxidoreductase [Phycisphaeraceae bacterium]